MTDRKQDAIQLLSSIDGRLQRIERDYEKLDKLANALFSLTKQLRRVFASRTMQPALAFDAPEKSFKPTNPADGLKAAGGEVEHWECEDCDWTGPSNHYLDHRCTAA